MKKVKDCCKILIVLCLSILFSFPQTVFSFNTNEKIYQKITLQDGSGIEIGKWNYNSNFLSIPEDGRKNTLVTYKDKSGKNITQRVDWVNASVFAILFNKKRSPDKMAFTLGLPNELINELRKNAQSIIVLVDNNELNQISKFNTQLGNSTITFEWDSKLSKIISQAKKGNILHVGVITGRIMIHSQYPLKGFSGALKAATKNR